MVSMAERPSGGKRHVCGKPRPQCLCWSYLIVIFEAQAGGAEELVGEGEKASARRPAFSASKNEPPPRDTAERPLLALGAFLRLDLSPEGALRVLVMQKMSEMPTGAVAAGLEWAVVSGGSAEHL